jgi:hypothetical protein
MTTEMKMDWLVKSGNSDVAIGFIAVGAGPTIKQSILHSTHQTHTQKTDNQPVYLSVMRANNNDTVKGTVPK